MATGSRPRPFDLCGPLSPLLAEFDFDSGDSFARLQPPIFHEETKGQLTFDESSSFRFLADQSSSTSVEIVRGEFAEIGVSSGSIVAAIERGENPVAFSSPLTLFRVGVQAIKTTVHARVDVYRSGAPRPVVTISQVKSIDLTGELPPDEHLLLGHISLEPDRLASVKFRGRAQFSATARVTLRDADLPTSFRCHHQAGDERDRGWLRSGETFIDRIELDPSSASFAISRLDFGLTYRSLRQALRQVARRKNQLPVLTVTVNVDMIREDGSTESLTQQTHDVQIIGSPADTISFSGLCGSASRRLVLTHGQMQPAAYEFPKVRVRYRRGSYARWVVEPIELTVGSESENLRIEIVATLRSPHQEWIISESSHLFEAGSSLIKFQMPLEQFIDKAVADVKPGEKATIEISAQVRDRSADGPIAPNQFKFFTELEIEREPPNWLCCVDFGTSSTAIWIVNTSPLLQGYQLELGDWLSRIDPLHSESTVWLGANWSVRSSAAGKRVSWLLPSAIGLSSQLHLRADFDPLSLGDLRKSLPGAEGTNLRLSTLDRTYDVSVPFPSTAHLSDESYAIVTEPKKRMIMRADHVTLNASVAERDGTGHISPVRRIELAKLVEDCFSELGGYTALSVLSEEAANAPSSIAHEIEQARVDESSGFGIVVTHPYGVDETRREIYRRAGERFLLAFCGAEKAQRGGVRLAAEALAAARFGIQDFMTRNPTVAARACNFVTLDIGAGTYDVTVINYDGSETGNWRILNHFGLAIGGNDLDRVLNRRVAAILKAAAESSEVAEHFQIDAVAYDDDSNGNSFHEHPVRHRFKLEFLAAKARLTYVLLDAQRDNYHWQRRADGGPPLEIKVGEAGPVVASSENVWAVQSKRANQVACEIMPGAELRYERSSDGTPSLRLLLWRDVFDGPPLFGSDGLGVLLEAMGGELPRLALSQAQLGEGRSAVVIVTGRAALWPMLYERIENTVSAQGSHVSMARPKPFSADLMKQAVVRGAVDLLPNSFDSEFEIDNPIAIITFKANVDLTHARGPSRAIDTVTLLVDDRAEGQRSDIVTRGPFVIARVIPGFDHPRGLEDRLRLFRSLHEICGIKPFIELTHELVPAARGRVQWRIKWRRDASGLRLVFDSDAEPGFEFGPFGGGRVYGPR